MSLHFYDAILGHALPLRETRSVPNLRASAMFKVAPVQSPLPAHLQSTSGTTRTLPPGQAEIYNELDKIQSDLERDWRIVDTIETNLHALQISLREYLQSSQQEIPEVAAGHAQMHKLGQKVLKTIQQYHRRANFLQTITDLLRDRSFDRADDAVMRAPIDKARSIAASLKAKAESIANMSEPLQAKFAQVQNPRVSASIRASTRKGWTPVSQDLHRIIDRLETCAGDVEQAQKLITQFAKRMHGMDTEHRQREEELPSAIRGTATKLRGILENTHRRHPQRLYRRLPELRRQAIAHFIDADEVFEDLDLAIRRCEAGQASRGRFIIPRPATF